MKKGSHLTEEQKDKLRHRDCNGVNNSFYGKHHTEDAKQRNREAHLGKRLSLETRQRMSATHKENNVWAGRKHSAESIDKMRLAHLGKKDSDLAREHKRAARLGYKMSAESKQKLSMKLKGKAKSAEHRKKIGISKKGNKYRLGFVNSAEHCQRISMSKKGKKASLKAIIMNSYSHSGIKNPAYIHGMAHEPYTPDWKRFGKRESIQARDNNICQLCKRHIEENNLKHSIHHIDYNKKNCDELNLILLCRSCHAKTNHKERSMWQSVFEEIIWNIYWGLDKSFFVC